MYGRNVWAENISLTYDTLVETHLKGKERKGKEKEMPLSRCVSTAHIDHTKGSEHLDPTHINSLMTIFIDNDNTKNRSPLTTRSQPPQNNPTPFPPTSLYLPPHTLTHSLTYIPSLNPPHTPPHLPLHPRYRPCSLSPMRLTTIPLLLLLPLSLSHSHSLHHPDPLPFPLLHPLRHRCSGVGPEGLRGV